MKYFFSILFILVIFLLVNYVIIKNKQINIMDTKSIKYGEVVQFKENEVLQFPEFSLVYVGETNTKVDFNPNLEFIYYNFVVTALDGKEKKISWSAGTGLIAPVDFSIGNKLYQLELGYAESIDRRLANNEMVISLSKNDDLE
jgi:hypothetical protein